MCSTTDCVECDDQDVCEKCMDGYWLDSLSCEMCDSSCLTCDGGAPEDCLSCQSPLSLASDGTCITCGTDCRTCKPEDVDFCLTCLQEFSLDANGSGNCYTCDEENCLKCTAEDTSICEACKDGFTLFND